MKLIDGSVGCTYLVQMIDLDIKIKRRLEILGMTVNSKVEIMNSKRSGTKIIKVRGTRLALGAEFSRGIEVILAEGSDRTCEEK